MIKSVENKDMSIRQACTFYNISKTTLQRWLKNQVIKQTRDKPPNKIPNKLLLKDVAQYSDDYMYERAQRLGCSKSGIEIALKRLGIRQKNTLEHPKTCPMKKATYQSKFDSFTQQGYPIVYMDEIGFEAETIRPYGYAAIGKPYIYSYNRQKKSELTLLDLLQKS